MTSLHSNVIVPLAGLVLLLSVGASALTTVSSPRFTSPYCTNAYFWLPDGNIVKGNAKWSTFPFEEGPCFQVAGIGITETYLKTLIVVDRTDAINTYMPMPGFDGMLAYAQEINLNHPTWPQRPLNVITNTFCASGQHMQNGTFFMIGGDQKVGNGADYVNAGGGFSIRSFKPCTTGACDFVLEEDMARRRWYPTTQLLPDGRMLIVGGGSVGGGINDIFNNEPSLEYYPKNTGKGDGPYFTKFLIDTLPYNLYPFVHLLPNGLVFIFASDSYIIWDTAANDVVPGNYPQIQANDANGNAIKRSYPLAGSSVMFQLTPRNGYTAEIMVCGGGSEDAFRKTPVHFVQNEWAPADSSCWRITPLDPNPVWAHEPMRYTRVTSMMVLLPDANVLILGGAATGSQGMPNCAHNASLGPEMYNSLTHKWYRGNLGMSKIPRVYHSSSLLLHDSRVLISGSAPHQDGIKLIGMDFPTEFRSEFYYPPYHRPNIPFPSLLTAPKRITVGTMFQITFKGLSAPAAKAFSVVLAQPGFATHGANHGMRNVELVIKSLKVIKGGVYNAVVAAPPNLILTPPTWYWLFVLVNGVPNREGLHVFVN